MKTNAVRGLRREVEKVLIEWELSGLSASSGSEEIVRRILSSEHTGAALVERLGNMARRHGRRGPKQTAT